MLIWENEWKSSRELKRKRLKVFVCDDMKIFEWKAWIYKMEVLNVDIPERHHIENEWDNKCLVCVCYFVMVSQRRIQRDSMCTEWKPHGKAIYYAHTVNKLVLSIWLHRFGKASQKKTTTTLVQVQRSNSCTKEVCFVNSYKMRDLNQMRILIDNMFAFQITKATWI